jgi:hypothetical protein
METPMRTAALLILTALPLQAQTVDPLPNFSLDSAITCLAYTANEIERYPDYAANRVEWMVFFSRLIAVKSTEADLAEFNALFAQELAALRNPMIDEGVPATPEEADEILTGTGKMCWFQALAAEGGPYEGQ